jgi:calcium/calmodulin-dependent protein kinase I
MDCKFMRIKNSIDEESEEATDKLRLRFIRNLKYCDLYARNEEECRQWIDNLGRVMVRTDFHERFKVKKVLGEGSFAKVYLGHNFQDGKLYAIKAFGKDNLNRQNKGKAALKNEIDILLALDNSNLMCLHEVHESKNSLYLVCEYLNGGSMNDYLKNSEEFLTADQVLDIIL